MRTRPFVYAALALAATLPAPALAAVTVRTAAIQAPAGDVAAGATVGIVCTAEGNSTRSMLGSTTTTIDGISVTVSGGTVSPSQLTGAAPRTCSSGTGTCSWLQGTASWVTPGAPGTLTATCTVAYSNTGAYGAVTRGTVATSASITTVAAADLPPVVSAVNGPAQRIVDAAGVFDVTATDPNPAQQPLAYTWSATGGTIAADPSNPSVATWTAPSSPGRFDVVVTVSRGSLAVEARRSVDVVIAEYQAGLPVVVRTPTRVAAADDGALFVVETGPGATGRLALLTKRGEARGFVSLPESPLAAVHGAGFLWVTTVGGSLYKVDPVKGRVLGKIPLADGRLGRPAGIAYEPTRMQLWIADADEARVRVVGLDGGTARVVQGAGGAPLRQPIDVALDPAAGRAWVLSGDAKKANALEAGEPLFLSKFLHAYDLDGNYVASHGRRDVDLTRAGGVAVGAGSRVYVTDTFQGQVVVFDGAGTRTTALASFGTEPGQLKNPTGLAFLANGDLAVASTTLGRVDRFGTGAALPACAGDADCDGLPDDWEVAHRLDPRWAGDALLDYDGDGLNEAEELALGTDPRRSDTDGDGFTDGDEVLAGFDPLDPTDHRPVVVATGPGEVPPGLVRMQAIATLRTGCAAPTFAWAQAGGPAVALGGADSASPSFVAREVGSYAFEAVAACAGQTSLAARVEVAVRNVPPLADAGRLVVAAPGDPIRLDAGLSSDANGDALTYGWDQTLGRALTGAQAGAALDLRARAPGLYTFALTARDARGAAATAQVPVLVAAGPVATAIAAAIPQEAAVGATVTLDATASLVTEDAPSFSWEQLSGPAVTLIAATAPVASFVPPAPGRYAFAVTVGERGIQSPPARVEVFVAGAGAALPAVERARAAASVVAVGAPVALEAAGTGSGWAWTQVSGPAAGLSDADAATATAVPFAPGFHVFEVSARDGAAVSRPVRVAFEARAGGEAIPVARVAVPGLPPRARQLVFLDGTQSTGATRYRWTQLEGAWVVLSGQAAVTTFRPPAPGRYVFELEVDDGAVRSAPARVEVDVSEQGVE